MNEFSVRIGNINISDVTEVFIRKSMDSLSGITLFKTANVYLQAQKNIDVYFDDSFDAYIDKTPVVKGKVEIINVKYSKNENYVQIGGRDSTAILVDCNWDAEPNEWKKMSISNLVNVICSEFGVSLTIDSTVSSIVTKKIESFKINEGEKVFDAIKRLCSENRILPISYGDNRLTLTNILTDNLMSENIKTGGFRTLEATTTQSNIDRYNSYTVKGTGVETSNKDLKSYLQVHGNSVDSVITNTKRKKVHLSESELDFAKAQEQADYIKNMHAGYSRPYMYTLKDWTTTNGDLWEINSLVSIQDTFLRLKKKLLIYQTDFIYNKTDGFITKLYLVDKNTYTNNSGNIKSEFDR